MTDKQINIVEILAEQCKNCTLYEGDTVSLNISIFDRQLKGVCFNNNIYFSVDELNYIMQKLISKEQECNRLKAENDELEDLNTRLDNQREAYWKEYQKLSKTLIEIKEIAEAESYLSPQSTRLLVHKILQKISEVKDD
jgi:hypothetical protein